MRALLRLALVAGILAGAAILGAPVASAYACGPPSVELPNGVCVDLIDGSGSGGAPSAPVELTQPSSVLAAANGDGGTVAENANLALANGEAGAAGKIGLAGRLGQVGAVVSAGYFGYQVGSAFDEFACQHFGWTDLCSPTAGAGFSPNVDVVIGDPGWLVAGGVVSNMQLYQTFNGAGNPPVTGPAQFAPIDPVPSVGTLLPNTWTGTGLVFTATGGASKYPRGGQVWVYRSSSGLKSCSSGYPDGTGANSTGTTYMPATAICAVGASSGGVPDVVFICAAACGLSTGMGYSDAVAAVGAAGGTAYAFPGSTYRPAPAPSDPLRQWVTTTTCKTAAGATVTLTATSDQFHETDGAWPPIPTSDCPAGSTPTQVTVDETGDGVPDKQIWDLTVPDPVVQQQLTHPECTTGKCRLDLQKIGPTGTPLGDCFAQSGLCVGWSTDPDKADDYQCTYGLPGSAAMVDLSECNVYTPTFDPQEQAKGVVTADPATGEVPSTVDTTTDPGEAGQGSAQSSSCWPSGYAAFNPFEWVLMPVECALKWAFVPDPAELTQTMTQTWTDISARPPISIVAPMVTFVQGFVGAAGSTCTGSIADFSHGLVIPCEPPAGIATFVTILKWVISVLFAGYFVFAVWSMVEKSLQR